MVPRGCTTLHQPGRAGHPTRNSSPLRRSWRGFFLPYILDGTGGSRGGLTLDVDDVLDDVAFWTCIGTKTMTINVSVARTTYQCPSEFVSNDLSLARRRPGDRHGFTRQ